MRRSRVPYRLRQLRHTLAGDGVECLIREFVGASDLWISARNMDKLDSSKPRSQLLSTLPERFQRDGLHSILPAHLLDKQLAI